MILEEGNMKENKGFLLILAICTSICIGVLIALMYNFVTILINGFWALETSSKAHFSKFEH